MGWVIGLGFIFLCFAIDEAACRIADAIKDNRGSGAEESNR